MAFDLLLPLTIIRMVLLWFVNPEKAMLETKEYLGDEARHHYHNRSHKEKIAV